jgi:RNA polymerase sigma-70 factor, ECF subfamily
MVDLDRFTMEQAIKGNPRAFKRLYDHYAPFVWRIVYRATGNDDEAAQEIVQETFVCIHRSLKSFTWASSPGTWIYRITLNASYRFLAIRNRRQKILLPLGCDVPGRIPGPEAYDTREFVTMILDSLTPQDRFLLMAKEVDGLTFRELADIFGITPPTLRLRMYRLKKKLHGKFETDRVIRSKAA